MEGNNVFPVPWFDGPARILTKVVGLGLGLRPLRCEDCDDPNADGDATPLGHPVPHDETVSCVSIY